MLLAEVSGSGANYYKIDVVDANNKKVTLKVTVAGKIAITNALLQSVGVSGFDATKVKSVVLVVDDASATTGTLTLTTAGLAYTPVVPGVPYDVSAITSLPGSPVVSSNHGTTVATNNATITTTQTSATTFNATSNVSAAGEFTFSTIGWGYFDAGGAFVGTAASLGNSVTLALNGTVGKVLKVEFVSSANQNVRKVFLVTLAAGQQNFTFDITGLGVCAEG